MTAAVMERRPTRPSLLPPGSSALEKLVDDELPQWDALLGSVSSHSGNTLNLPGFKPWLAAEWGLSPFVDQFDSLDELFAAGVPWLLERGSAASVRRVLGWLGYTTNVVLEEEGPYLHIDLGRVASAQELEVVARLVRHSIPLHVHFYRVYHGWDLRALRLDGGQPLDQAMLDTDSGAWVNTSTGALKVSFVSWHRRLLPKQPEGDVHWVHTAWHSDRLPHRAAGTLRWDSGGGWGPGTWAPGLDGNRTDMGGARAPAATTGAPLTSVQALAVALLPVAQASVSDTTQQALSATTSAQRDATDPAAATVLALHSTNADTATTGEPLSSVQALQSGALSVIVRSLGNGYHAHTRQTVCPPRLQWLGWGTQSWAAADTWSLTLDSRASTSTT